MSFIKTFHCCLTFGVSSLISIVILGAQATAGTATVTAVPAFPSFPSFPSLKMTSKDLAKSSVQSSGPSSGLSSMQVIKTWSASDISKLKGAESTEKDPSTGKPVHFRGVLLSTVVDKTLADLPAERRAEIDLVILKAKSGEQALIPRAFVARYPFLLISRSNQGFASVAPWTSQPKLQQEGLPLESYFVGAVQEIELAHSTTTYQGFVLQRRKDPAAMRGEKYFLKNCISCHSGQGPGLSIAELAKEPKTRKLASEGHSPGKGIPKLDPKDRRFVQSYLEAYRAENVSAPSLPPAPAKEAVLGSSAVKTTN